MAEGVSEEEFYAESAAWAAARGAAPAARELLDLGAHGDPGDRLLAVAAVTRIGAAAAPAWRDSLDVPPMSGYAKITLAMLEDDGSAGRAGGAGTVASGRRLDGDRPAGARLRRRVSRPG